MTGRLKRSLNAGSAENFWVLLTGVLLVVCLVAWMVRRRLTQQLTYQLNRAAQDLCAEVLVPDGNGGQIHLDYLLLGSRAIWVILYRKDQGTVFCSDTMSDWTVMGENNRYTFPNPLPALYDKVAAVRRIAPEAEVNGAILFPDQAEFSKGRPDQVYLPSEILDLIKAEDNSESEPVRELKGAWENLLEVLRPA